MLREGPSLSFDPQQISQRRENFRLAAMTYQGYIDR
jgi:hypothetical protein